MLSPNRINLIARLRENPVRAAGSRRNLRRFLLPLAVLVAVLLAESVYIFGIQWSLNREYDRLSEYMSVNQISYADARTLIGERDLLEQQNAALREAFTAIDSHGELSRALFESIYLAADRCAVRIEGLVFDRAAGIIELSCLGPGVYAAADYTGELEALPGVSSAEYGGYRLAAPAGQDTEATYSFSIACHLSGGGDGND